MCSGNGHYGYPEATKDSPCPQQLEEQVRLLQHQNARLRQQQLQLETQVKEQTLQLRQQHDEEMSQRVARHARDMAGVVMQHEEEMRRLSQRYENQLALGPTPALPCLPRPGQGRSGAPETALGKAPKPKEAPAIRRALTCEESRLGAAGKCESDAEVARYRRKAQKLKAKRGEELRSIRAKVCQGMMLVSEREEAAWLCVVLRAWRGQADHASEAAVAVPSAPEWPLLLAGEGPAVLSLALARGALTALAALRAWLAAVALSRHEAELRTQQDKAMSRSTAAIAMLRNESRALRCQGRRAAMRASQRWMLLTMARPFTAWKDITKEARHAMRFQTRQEETDHSTMTALRTARAEVQAFRMLGRRRAEVAASRKALLTCAPVLSAWRQQTDSGKTSRRLRPGEVLLNSGEAAKRAEKQLAEVRAQSAEQLAELEKENAELRNEASNARKASGAAARREARVENISRRHELAAKRGEELAALLACMKAWIGEVVLARSTAALRKEAEERLAESLARARLESRGALHRAWSGSGPDITACIKVSCFQSAHAAFRASSPATRTNRPWAR
ncbi:nipblb [Symbiodinium natans]|uniref:Nipblb protein n=1 Tax=Symbiodinium natans TaxID=878477 RepID=A0A812TW07_9DINO|nr:nipblb [Symbiodinium natans]